MSSSAAAAEPDADAVAAAVLGCLAVARLGGAGVSDPTTYLPGRRIRGVAVRDRTVEVSVTGTADATAVALIEQVCPAVATLIGDRDLHLRFADIDVPAASPSSAVRR